MDIINLAFNKGSVFLVTGGAGFIGSNLAEHLVKCGYQIKILDNFSTGKRSNLNDFLNYSNCTLIEGDIRDLETCQKACSGVDYVLHQAALGSVPRSINDPKTTNDVNISGMLNMLIAARDNGVKRFVYASSSSVYGDHPNLPKREDIIGKTLSPYATTKYVNELYAKNFYDLFGLKVIGLRYFNVFGKRQDPDSVYAAVIPLFVKKLLSGESCVINGDGKQSRDFSYIDNVVQANIKACLAPDGACGEVYNIAYGQRIFLIDIYKKLCQELNKQIEPIYGFERKGDIKHSFADISKARDGLGYEPQVDAFKGIELSIQWYKNNLGY